jgi:group I intron endonuclease
MAIIYKATNRVNGKVYIGRTERPLRTRKSEHKSHAGRDGQVFGRAINKYGFDAFDWAVLEECSSIKHMHLLEEFWIDWFQSADRKNGYNRSTGGEGAIGVKVSGETRAKLSRAAKGRKQTPEHIEKRVSQYRGKPCPEGTREYMRNRVVSDATKEKQRQNRLGKSYEYSEQGRENHMEANNRKIQSRVACKIPTAATPDINARRGAGESFAAIASVYSVSPQTVMRFCRQFGG